MHWKNKIVLITGAASGIGLALSKEMIRRGAMVWMTDISADIHERAKNLGDNATSEILDVSCIKGFQAFISKITSTHKQIDYLFNNAGIGYGCDAGELTHEHYDHYIDINIRGVTNGISLVYPIMIKQGFGTIVNTASVGGLIPSSLMAPYAMTKHAVVGLSISLREEAKHKGVNVNTLCPGSVNTPIFDSTSPNSLPRVRSTKLREYTREKDVSISPELFAFNALNDIEKNKSLIIYPKMFRFIVWLYKNFPRIYSLITNQNLKQEFNRVKQE
ncbi:hypothetical protein A9Q99_00925 [Gammaproteobacteria bacterium 45_16_T64]|nr:hypothetical protein A9Q99_00925 [Gammaproteobacteria bacterium 45_16_T64]